ncbi:MAG: HD domain-containing protein [Candidatus Shapirobacteria bacterium]|nr:HD domain-containing protein [Candidatus Shapirobacteria bacterium]
MKYLDRVYGEFNITEPVILELINCPTLQRLRDIDQGGYRPLWIKPSVNTGKYDHSRFAHSLGVYLLLYKYQAPIEEQIAGLIHDVSHSAFSHCIDYILKAGSEKEHNHQDNLFDKYVRKTEIPKIIKKFGFDLEYILNDENFPLKEKSLPDLCADRIDYSLKTAVIFNELNEQDKNYLLENLITKNNQWFFKTLKSAQKYAKLFLKLNTIYYSGLPSAIMFRTVGDCLKYALQKEYILEKDLYTTDKIVIEKIKTLLNNDPRLELLWERMNNKLKIDNNPANYDTQVFCKSRMVDPLFRNNGTLRRISEVESNWSNIIKQELKPKQYFLKFEK